VEGKMNIVKQLVFAACIFISVNKLALAETMPNEPRGGLLYSTHCSVCHNSTIHWREQKLATDWPSLKIQVKLWQGYANLNWTEEDIVDVSAYLNAHYYNFISTEQKVVLQTKTSKQH
jgi:hypothetical protein